MIRNRVPITVAVGAALPPMGTADQLNAALRQAMESLLYRVQQEYLHPRGAYRAPRRLGGGVPSPDDSRALRAAELLDRARKKQKRRS